MSAANDRRGTAHQPPSGRRMTRSMSIEPVQANLPASRTNATAQQPKSGPGRAARKITGQKAPRPPPIREASEEFSLDRDFDTQGEEDSLSSAEEDDVINNVKADAQVTSGSILESRTDKLLTASRAVLISIRNRRANGPHPTMAVNLKAWQSAREAIDEDAELNYFVDETEVFESYFVPPSKAPALSRAIQESNLTSLAYILYDPVKAAQSNTSDKEGIPPAVHALEAAFDWFFDLCVPKPWTDEGAMQMLVDIATRVSF